MMNFYLNFNIYCIRNSDVLAPAWGQRPGQAEPKKAGPSQAKTLAWDGFWPGLGFGKAKAVGLGHGFSYRKFLSTWESRRWIFHNFSTNFYFILYLFVFSLITTTTNNNNTSVCGCAARLVTIICTKTMKFWQIEETPRVHRHLKKIYRVELFVKAISSGLTNYVIRHTS